MSTLPGLAESTEDRMSIATVVSNAPTSRTGDQSDVLQRTYTTIIPSSDTNSLMQTETNYWTSILIRALFALEEPSGGDLALIKTSMINLHFPSSWSATPRLYAILRRTGRLDRFEVMIEAGVTDLWLPMNKRVVRKWFTDGHSTSMFLRWQELCLDRDIPTTFHREHFSLADADELDLSMVKLLGAGGFGEVHLVKSRRNAREYARKTMSRPVKYDNHLDLMRNFRREIDGMRRVQHHHCVVFVASCTDMDTVTLLSLPVADMDLSTLLDMDLDETMTNLLYNAVGCITAALAYLHRRNIR